MSDPRPIGVFDSGVGGLTVLREIVRRSPAESTIYLGDNARAPYGVRSDDEVLAFSTRVARPARRARRQGHRRRLQHLHRGRASARSGAATTCRSWASSGRARRRRRWPPATAGSASSRRRRRSARTPTSGRSRTRTPRSRSTSTRRRPSCRWSRPATLSGPDRRGGGRRRARAAARRARRGRRVDLPAAAGRDDRHAAARLHPLPAAARRSSPALVGRAGRDRRFGDGDRVGPGRAARHQRAAIARPATRPDAADGRDAPPADDRRSRATFHALASRLFGSAFPDVERVELAVAGPMTGSRPAAPSGRTRPSWRDDRVWQAGFLIGSALGAAATVAGRHAETVRPPRAGRLAGGRADRHRPAALARRARSTPAELRAAEPAYAEAMARIVPALSARARQPRCRASSSGPASSIGPAGSAPTPARSRRS